MLRQTKGSDNAPVQMDEGWQRRARAAAAAAAVLSVLATAGSVVLYFHNRAHLAAPPHYLFGDAAAGLLYPVAGALLLRRRADNSVGWVFAATSVLGLNAFCNQYAVAAYLVDRHRLPLGGLAAWTATWGWAPELAVPALLPLLFPDGRLPSPRWRPYARIVAAVVVVTTLAGMLSPAPIDASDAIHNPLGSSKFFEVLLSAGAAASLLVFTPVGMVALLIRQRRATGVQRAQLSWLTFATVVAVVAIIAAVILPGVWSEAAWSVAVAALPAGVLISVLRHRLLDIEVVLNRSVVYVLITAVVLLAYAGAVALLGAAGQRVGIAAVAVLALVLAAGRERLQHQVERFLYGERRDPYAVVTRLGERVDVAARPRDALHELAEELRRALRLPSVAVRPCDPRLQPVESGRVRAGTTAVPVTVMGRHVADLEVGLRHPGERLRAAEVALLTEVARRAGALVQAAVLVADLQHSRERLVAAREEERRRLRRDLHDGVGPELAGMALQLDSLASRVRDDPTLVERVRLLRDRMRGTVVEVRRVVDDLRPPALDELGLAGALREHLAVYSSAPDGASVELSADGLPEGLPAAVEVAAYRIVAEAVANAMRHGHAAHCAVRLSLHDGGVGVEVTDDGSGIAADARPGVGLQSIDDRATEIGGSLEVSSGPSGTTVRAWLPLEG